MTVSVARVDAPGAEDQRRLPLRICVGWGLGSLGVAATFNVINVLLLRYLVDFVGITAGLAGTLVGASKLYDAVIDPFVGGLSDRSRSRFGRRRPFMLAGGLMLAGSLLILFNVPGGLGHGAALGYVTFGLLFYATAYATFNVPYIAMPAEMTRDYHERSFLISFRVLAVAVASMIATFAGPVLIGRYGGGQAGFQAMSLFVAGLVVVTTVVSVLETRGAPMHAGLETHRLSLGRKLRLAFENRPFMLLLVVKLLQLTALAVSQAVAPFLFRRVLNLSDAQLGYYFLVFYGTMILTQPLWVRASRRYGKRDVYLGITAVYACFYLTWYAVQPGQAYALVLLRAVLIGGLGGGVLLFGQSLLPDTMELDYRRTGLRREGMLSAVYTIVEKLAYAVGAAATGIALSRAGYVQSAGVAAQPAAAVTTIFILASFVPAALLLLSVLALKFYDLSEARLKSATRVPGT